MERHLSDYEMTLLAEGVGSEAMRLWLSDHLIDCETCRSRLAACIRDGRSASEGTGSDLEQAPLGPPATPAFVRETMVMIRNTLGTTSGSDPALKVLQLYPMLNEHEGTVPLAAQSSEISDTLPVLASADGSLMVRFRQVSPGKLFRAYVVHDQPLAGVALRLSFPNRGLTFDIDDQGEADLQGIKRNDLAKGSLEVELLPVAGTGDG